MIHWSAIDLSDITAPTYLVLQKFPHLLSSGGDHGLSFALQNSQ